MEAYASYDVMTNGAPLPFDSLDKTDFRMCHHQSQKTFVVGDIDKDVTLV